MFFEGAEFLPAAHGAPRASDFGSLSGLSLLNLTDCTKGGGGVGADCFGAPRPAVRYDRRPGAASDFETSYGTVEQAFTPEHNFWDAAGFYTADWNSIKLSAAAAYTKQGA